MCLFHVVKALRKQISETILARAACERLNFFLLQELILPSVSLAPEVTADYALLRADVESS